MSAPLVKRQTPRKKPSRKLNLRINSELMNEFKMFNGFVASQADDELQDSQRRL
jgi:uncharacterized protein YdeI (YjbR/CyaY-like superfamily)